MDPDARGISVSVFRRVEPLNTSIFTVGPGLPVELQLITCVDPCVHISPPFGDSTLIDAPLAVLMVKGASLISVYAALLVLVTLIL